MAFSFGAPASKPTLNLNLGASANTNTNAGTSLFATGGAFPNTTANAAAPTATATNLGTTTANNSANPQIDIAHLRSTTKWDHLTPQLQQEIAALDTAILNQIKQSSEVGDLLPTVIAAGQQIAPGIEFVLAKLEELETGLENDAEAIVGLRDDSVRKDEGEAKCVFRTVDRLRIPRQYQAAHAADVGSNSPAFGGVGSGLGGWWNHPQTLRGSVRATGAGGHSLQLVEEDVDDGSGPKNLVALFEDRANEMAELSQRHTGLLNEIEDFVGGLEGKLIGKERELNERLELGDQATFEDEKAQQMQLLQFVFGEVQKNLYEVAEKIGVTRDGVVDLSFGR